MSTVTKQIVRYDWPGTPTLTIDEIRALQKIDEEARKITFMKVIVEAVDITGEKWTAETPPQIPGYYFQDN